MPADRRTSRDERRRRLGQNFLLPQWAERFLEDAAVLPGDLVVDIGAGRGAFALPLARQGAEVMAVELDPVWADRLEADARKEQLGRLRVVHGDIRRLRMPDRPFRVVGCLPFGATTDILRHLLDDPGTLLERADLIVQAEVAHKRAAAPPTTLLSTLWAPWWQLERGRRIPAQGFRPVPGVDGAVLTAVRRDPPLLPVAMAASWARYVRAHWPWDARSGQASRGSTDSGLMP